MRLPWVYAADSESKDALVTPFSGEITSITSPSDADRWFKNSVIFGQEEHALSISGKSVLVGPVRRDSMGILRPVQDDEDPGYCKDCPGHLAGSNGSPLPGCKNTRENTRNDLAAAFAGKYSGLFSGVAGIVIKRQNDSRWRIIGTASLINSESLLTGAHVIRKLQTAQASGASAFAVFDLPIDRFPEGIPGSVSFDNDKSAQKLSPDVKTDINSQRDIGVIKIPVQPKRPILKFETQKAKAGDDIIALGIPGPPEEQDTATGRYFRNFAVCGVQSVPYAIFMRVLTGKLVRYDPSDPPNVFRIYVDTVGGTSGSPILNARTGRIIGVISAAPTVPRPDRLPDGAIINGYNLGTSIEAL